jgi:hypothetical protein
LKPLLNQGLIEDSQEVPDSQGPDSASDTVPFLANTQVFTEALLPDLVKEAMLPELIQEAIEELDAKGKWSMPESPGTITTPPKVILDDSGCATPPKVI